MNITVKPLAYQLPVTGEKIIRSSPSTGPCEVFQCDLFFGISKIGKQLKESGSKIKQPYKLDYIDPWIVLKSIPNATIVNQNLVLTEEKT